MSRQYKNGVVSHYLPKRPDGREAQVGGREKDLTDIIYDARAKELYIRRKAVADGTLNWQETLTDEELDYLVKVLENKGQSLQHGNVVKMLDDTSEGVEG